MISEKNEMTYQILSSIAPRYSWYSRFRHSTRYMNHARFSFFILLACHLNNKYRAYKREIDEEGKDDENHDE